MKKKTNATKKNSKPVSKKIRPQSRAVVNRRNQKGKAVEKRKQPSAKSKTKISSNTKRTAPKKSTAASKRPKRKTGAYTIAGTKNLNTKNQITYYFPEGIAEKDKVKNLEQWNGEALKPYIYKNKPVMRKGQRVYSISNAPVIGSASGSQKPQSLYIKLEKHKPRGKVKYFSSEISPVDAIIDLKFAKAFAVGVLNKYYEDHIGADKDTVKTRKLGSRKDSDPEDLDGKPMKVSAVIFHFIY